MAAVTVTSPFLPNVMSGQVALVTGGGSGIGLVIAKQFGLHGARVAIMGRKAAKLQAAAAELTAAGVTVIPVVGDVRSVEAAEAAVSAVIKAFGRLDVLVNCAAGNFLCLAEDLSTNAFKTVVDIDLVGTFNMSKAALEALKASKGSIINITATLHYGATPYVIHASAAKAGVDALTRGLATEFHEYNIRVNGVAPGPIRDTEGMDRLAPMAGTEQVAVRWGEKEEIALTCVFLCCGAANYINGETIVVDGGTWMLKPAMPKAIYQQTVRKASRPAASPAKPQSKL